MRTENDSLPNFLVIGAQRCATSWIYQSLKGHPDIFLPFIKEINFFDRYYSEGLDWYKRYFELYKNEKAIGEVTPSYLYNKEAPERIAKILPGVRLVACLRNPIERAFSQYRKQQKAGEVSSEFDKALEEIPVYINKGFYYTQIMRYMDSFSRDRLLILIYEDIEKDTVKFIQAIFNFLDVDTKHIPPAVFERITPNMLEQFQLYSSVGSLSASLRRLGLGKVIDTVKRSKMRLAVDSFYHRRSFKIKRQKSKDDSEKPVTIELETRRKLTDIFHKENQKLSKFLNRDLSFWR